MGSDSNRDIETKGASRIQVNLKKKDAQWWPVSCLVNATPIMAMASLDTRHYRDIKKRGDQGILRQSEEVSTNFLNHAPAGIYEFISEKNLRDVNDVMCEYTGYTKEELLS